MPRGAHDLGAGETMPSKLLEHGPCWPLPDGTPFSEVIEDLNGQCAAFPMTPLSQGGCGAVALEQVRRHGQISGAAPTDLKTVLCGGARRLCRQSVAEQGKCRPSR